MQSGPEAYFDVVELAKELRSEKLFVQSELDTIRNLNDKLEKNAVELAQATWTSTQQRSNVKQLFAQGDPSSTTCCQRIDYVLSPVFVDAHKVLRYQDALILSDLIQRVRASPSIVSLWLAAAESKRPAAAAAVARVLCGGLYIYDVSPLRRVLYHLAKHRLANSEDPRRIISQGSSSFSRLYCELVDGFRPARLFLAAALKGPMLPLLQIDECLVIDPDKALERVKKLFKSNNPNTDWQNQLARYRKWTVSTLVTSTSRFISSLRELWMCFPPTIAWVVRQTALALQSNRQISEEDIHSICTDLIFTNFICQAIVNPEAYGISDIPITNISRFNLVQVAQTIQTLCLMKYQEVDGKFRDFYQRFEKDSVFSLIDILLENESYSAIPNDNFGYNGSESGDTEDGISEGAACESEERDVLKTDPIVNPNIALFTRNDLHLLVSLLKGISISSNCGINSISDQLNSMKLNNPFLDPESDTKKEKSQKSDVTELNKKIFSDSNNHSDSETACGVSSMNDHSKIENPFDFLQDEEFTPLLKCVNPDLIVKVQKLLEKLPDSAFNWDNSNGQKPNGSVSKGKYSNSNSPIKNGPKKRKPPAQSQEVLVIKLPGDTSYEAIGLLPESRVLEYHYSTMVACRTLSEEMLQQGTGLANSRSMELLELPRQDPSNSAGTSHNNQPTVEASGPHPGQEKRTRFSLSHDEGSIGNTSDNLEAVSEAASNHSVTSSLEMETEDQNDNLSDMVSANVSGRGSPNISGRDTPSSQVTEGDAGVALANPQPLRQPSVTFDSAAASKQAKLLKRTRHDIEDKFCKFEIRKLIEGDETISIYSDTWSTDVLASDSETIGESTYDRNFIITHFGQQISRSAGQSTPSIAPSQPDISETASESAWSTDVLVSDADRMTEVDIDDCNSVARSDTDTARSEEAPPAPMRNASYSNQLSPINNNHNASCIRLQAGDASAIDVSNIPGTSGMANGSHNMNSHELIPSAGCSNFANNENLSSILQISRNAGTSLISPILSLDPPNYNITDSSANGNMNIHETVNFRSSDEITDMRGTNGPIGSNGFVNFSENLNPIPNLSSNSKLLSNHDHTVDIINSFKLANGNNLNSPEVDGFDFNIEEKRFDEAAGKILNLDLASPIVDANTLDNLNDSTSSFTNNGNATIRWLNDPCQEFPLYPDSDQSTSNMYFNYNPSCTEVINEFCKKNETLDLNNSEISFRPIKLENNISDGNLSENHISDDKHCHANLFLNKGKLECIYKKDSQKRCAIISPNQLDSDKMADILTKEPDFKESKPLQVFPGFSGNSTLKVVENCNLNRLNVSNNKKPDTSKACDDKNDSSLNEVISSGSAISLSTLSVNSVDTSTSDKSSSQEVNSENLTERRITPPIGNANLVNLDIKNHNVPIINDGANTLPRQSAPLGTNIAKLGSSTGAIPKSISFDATAEKTHRYHSGRRIVDDGNDGIGINFGELKNNVKRSGGNFLNKIKLFRNKSRVNSTNTISNYGKRPQESTGESSFKSPKDLDSRVPCDTNRIDNINPIPGSSTNGTKSNSELSDDILAKYRRKVSSSSDAATSDSTSHSGSMKNKNRGSMQPCDNPNISDVDSQVDRNSDLEFEALRRELRLVLSNMEIQNIELAAGRSGSLALACALRLEGAGGALGALSALGNLGSLDSSRAPSLLSALRVDAVARRPYISYLAKCRKSLLSTIAMLESEYVWQNNETQRQSALAVSARARASLASREPRLVDLQEKLRSGLVDERREALTAALNSLASEMAAEESWAGALAWELEQAALTIERVVMARVYIQAMFPNGDGDIMRDQLLHEHMVKLGSSGVGLPARRLVGAPWIPAQRILAHLPAYRTPRDKVDCIVRCVNSIMTLLSMSSDSSTPGADDLTPVLVYILIKANPPSLLSTVQFVTTFINAPLEGERLYCWTQFCAAIEYIKTMD